MKILKCDRCDNLSAAGPRLDDGWRAMAVTRHDKTIAAQYDLCHNCVAMLHGWVTSPHRMPD